MTLVYGICVPEHLSIDRKRVKPETYWMKSEHGGHD
jgi:hypothetical protein